MKMKKWLLGIVAMIGLSSPAFADSFGVRLGFPGLGAQYTSGESFRLAAYVNPYAFSIGFGAQGDLILGKIAALGGISDLNAYYGAGVHAGFFGASSLVSVINIGVQGTAWVEYQITPTLSAFWDVTVGPEFRLGDAPFGGFGFWVGSAVGVNLKI